MRKATEHVLRKDSSTDLTEMKLLGLYSKGQREVLSCLGKGDAFPVVGAQTSPCETPHVC